MNTQRTRVGGSEASTYRPGRDALDEDEPTELLHAFFHVFWCSRFRGQPWLRQDLVERMRSGG